MFPCVVYVTTAVPEKRPCWCKKCVTAPLWCTKHFWSFWLGRSCSLQQKSSRHCERTHFLLVEQALRHVLFSFSAWCCGHGATLVSRWEQKSFVVSCLLQHLACRAPAGQTGLSPWPLTVEQIQTSEYVYSDACSPPALCCFASVPVCYLHDFVLTETVWSSLCHKHHFKYGYRKITENDELMVTSSCCVMFMVWSVISCSWNQNQQAHLIKAIEETFLQM